MTWQQLIQHRGETNTSVREGLNDKVKALNKPMAYGFCDDASLFLKIKPAYPGKAR